MTISPELFEILACPKCKGKISVNHEGNALMCHSCQLAFPIKDEIPIMLIEEAQILSERNR